MRSRVLFIFFAVMCAVLAAPLLAQEGHPLVGTWLGTYGQDNHVTLVMDWNGKALSGVFNPGPNASPLQKFTLEATSQRWAVHFEVDAKDKSGKAVHYVVDGLIQDIGLPNRKLVGTWMVDGVKNNFSLTRQ